MTRATRIWLPLFAVVVFAAGVATGVILHETLEPPSVASELPAPRVSPHMLTSMLARELELTPEQQRQLEQIVRARRQSFVAAREELRTRLVTDASVLVADIQQNLNLTPEQRGRFDAFVARVRAKYLSPDSPAGPRPEEKERPRGL